MDSMCLCVKMPDAMVAILKGKGAEITVNANGFANKCGKCYDPCAPKFRSNMARDMFNMTMANPGAVMPKLGHMKMVSQDFFVASSPTDDCSSVPATLMANARQEACTGVSAFGILLLFANPARFHK